MGPHSYASSTSGPVAGHPELSAVSTYADNAKRQRAFEDAHPEVEILRPAEATSWRWLARWRNEAGAPADGDRMICIAGDLGMLMDRLERMFP